MLALNLSNLLSLRKEVTDNIQNIYLIELDFADELKAPVPNIDINVQHIHDIFTLKYRNAQILDFFEQIDN